MIDSLGSGGAQRQLVELACALHGRGYSVHVITYRAPDFFAPRLATAGIEIVHLGRGRRYDLTLPLRLARHLCEREVDVAHAFLVVPSVVALLALDLSGRGGRTALVASERGPLLAASARVAVMQRFVYTRADVVTANSRAAAHSLVADLGVDPGRVRYVANGIDAAAWSGDCGRRAAERRFRLALIGGFRTQKNHQLVLEALTLLAKADRARLEVWFVGARSGDGAVAAQIEREIGLRGLADSVRIFPPVWDVPALLAAIDCLLLPSLYEGCPNVILEAMASRVPVIATAVGEVPEMLRDGGGIVIDAAEPRRLLDAIARLVRMSDAERRVVGESGRRAAIDRYPLGSMVEAYELLYRDALVDLGRCT